MMTSVASALCCVSRSRGRKAVPGSSTSRVMTVGKANFQLINPPATIGVVQRIARPLRSGYLCSTVLQPCWLWVILAAPLALLFICCTVGTLFQLSEIFRISTFQHIAYYDIHAFIAPPRSALLITSMWTLWLCPCCLTGI